MGYDVFTGISKDPFMEEKMLWAKARNQTVGIPIESLSPLNVPFQVSKSISDPRTYSAKESFLLAESNNLVKRNSIIYKFIIKSSVGYNCFQL